ncbi:MAG: ABC transporter ATP-binding protein [Deltaproteobacteria bacterium]|nr:ABC transporter ATP-binding protein [Deltaproteobacteria bacterium]
MNLEIKDLTLRLHLKKPAGGYINVVDSIDLNVKGGEIAAVVGESGSGKSLLGLSILRLNPPGVSEIVSGSVKIKCLGEKDELDIIKLYPKDLPSVRGRLISMVFQDPNTSLNPVIKIGEQITEAIFAHEKRDKSEAKEIAISYLNRMNVDGRARFNSYPHELSGGMRQRVMIAMAMVLNPCFLIADEPTTALDVTTSLQVLNLIEKIRFESGLGVIFVTHDLSIAKNISDKVYVFYAGQVMECGKTEEVIDNPLHPYTVSLIKSIPSLSKDYMPGQKLFAIPGYLARDDFTPGKCRFYSRCFKKDKDCLQSIPLNDITRERSLRCIKV